MSRLDQARSWAQAGAIVGSACTYYAAGPILDGSVPRWLAVLVAAVVLAPFIRIDRITFYATAFVGFAALSLVWSPDPAGGFAQLWKMAAIAIIALAARPDQNTLIAVAGVAGLSWIMPFGGGYPAGGFGNPNFETEWLVGAAPLCVALTLSSKRWRWIGVAVLAIIVLRLLLNPSKAEFFVAWLVAMFFLLRFRQYYATALVFFAVIAAVVLWPNTFGIAESIQSRAQLFVGTLLMWLDYPVFGTGLGGFDYLFPAYQDGYRLFWEAPQFLPPAFYAATAHNDGLSLLAGMGVVGVLLAALIVWQIDDWRSPWVNSLLCLGAAAMIGFPLQTPATAVLAAICFGAALPSAAPVSWPWRWPLLSRPEPSKHTGHSAG